ncbi:SRPBCC domain-containing protein [Actinacidiphila alni]|uniref:SRPBCC family protein n=1 Tax=Actinacidiphila alni TaxID=380248 RepID=UPI00340FA2E9
MTGDDVVRVTRTLRAASRDEVTGEYPVVEPPHRLVFTWTAGTTEGQPTRVTVTLGATAAAGTDGDGEWTEMTVLRERLPTPRTSTGASAAWRDLADKPADHLARAGDRPD